MKLLSCISSGVDGLDSDTLYGSYLSAYRGYNVRKWMFFKLFVLK